MRVRCPHCEQKYEIDVKLLGRDLVCQACEGTMRFDFSSDPRRSESSSRSHAKDVNETTTGASNQKRIAGAKRRKMRVSTSARRQANPSPPAPSRSRGRKGLAVVALVILVGVGFYGYQVSIPRAQVTANQTRPLVVAEAFTVLDRSGALHAVAETYCHSCHNDKKTKGHLNLDALKLTGMDAATYEHLQMMRDSIVLAEMPPREEAQPTDAERVQLVRWLDSLMVANRARIYKERPQTVLRRLNNHELRATVRDLFLIDTDRLASIGEFPEDQRQGAYSNNGETLLMSSFQLAGYSKVGNEIADRILLADEDKKPEDRLFRAPFVTRKSLGYFQDKALGTEARTAWSTGFEKGRYQDFSCNNRFRIEKFFGRKTVTKNVFDTGGAPEAGEYLITIEASGRNRLPGGTRISHPKVYWDQDKPLTVQMYVDGEMVQQWPLPDNETATFSKKLWLEERQGFELRFAQGFAKGLEKFSHNPLADVFGKPNHPASPTVGQWRTFYCQHYPALRLSSVRVTGPVILDDTRTAHTRLFGGKKVRECDARSVIERLQRRAFRGYANTKNMATVLNQVARVEATSGKKAAIRLGIVATMNSPWFVYLPEDVDTDGNLTPLALANRLSYFLWGTMPDDELLRQAESGKLLNADVLASQARRMLASEKRSGLVSRMTNEWINLDNLGKMPPSQKEYPNYYKYRIEENGYLETETFVDDMILQNHPITNFIDSDYTFANRPLAMFYGLPNAKRFSEGKPVRVEIKDPNRGGLMGHAAVLTATADGAMTNPVMRGLWVLRTLMGDDVSEPPEIAEPIDVDLRKAKTFRSQLEAHSKVENCQGCHAKFDHFGFPLQAFDVVGNFRTVHEVSLNKRRVRKVPIDTSGKMPSGERFKNLAEMKAILLRERRKFAVGLTRSLLTMACGREISAIDDVEVQAIVDQAEPHGYGLGDLIRILIENPTFRRK